MTSTHDATHPVNKRYVAALSAVNRLQKKFGSRVTIHALGQTWGDAEPSIGIELPIEIFELIDESNAVEIEATLRAFLERLAAILATARR